MGSELVNDRIRPRGGQVYICLAHNSEIGFDSHISVLQGGSRRHNHCDFFDQVSRNSSQGAFFRSFMRSDILSSSDAS